MISTIIIIVFAITIIYLKFKIKKMAQQAVIDLQAASNKAVQTITDLKAVNAMQVITIGDLQAQIAAAIVPADITPITDELNAATA